MTIELEIMRDTPHSIADAIIDYRMRFAKEEYSRITAIEDIRLIGKALTDFVESCDRVNRIIEGTDCSWK